MVCPKPFEIKLAGANWQEIKASRSPEFTSFTWAWAMGIKIPKTTVIIINLLIIFFKMKNRHQFSDTGWVWLDNPARRNKTEPISGYGKKAILLI
jgi:hypothetical protein